MRPDSRKDPSLLGSPATSGAICGIGLRPHHVSKGPSAGPVEGPLERQGLVLFRPGKLYGPFGPTGVRLGPVTATYLKKIGTAKGRTGRPFDATVGHTPIKRTFSCGDSRQWR